MSLNFSPLKVQTPDWDGRVVRGVPADIHGFDPLEADADGAIATRRVWWCQPTERALVLGSRQTRDIVVDSSAAVVRRRSGGGAVVVGGDDTVWIDVTISRDDPLWVNDVGVSFEWLGDVWSEVVRGFGVSAEVHRGALECGRLGSLVCFAGRGPGEVLNDDGAKVVGLSQRRNRFGARFQCLALLEWDPKPYGDFLFAAPDRAAALEQLHVVAAGINRPGSPTVRAADVVNAFLAALP